MSHWCDLLEVGKRCLAVEVFVSKSLGQWNDGYFPEIIGFKSYDLIDRALSLRIEVS